MPIALSGEVYLCSDCPDGGSLKDKVPLRPESFGLVAEKDEVKSEFGRRVLGVVFASSNPIEVDKGATLPVLVMGTVEVRADKVNRETLASAVIDRYALCTGPDDSACRAMGTCVLAQLLREHSAATES